MYSLFDSLFYPSTRVVIVSEERLKQAEQKAKQKQIEQLDKRIAELTEYRAQLVGSVQVESEQPVAA